VVNNTRRWQHPNTTTSLLRHLATDCFGRHALPSATGSSTRATDRWLVSLTAALSLQLKNLRPSCQVDKTCFWTVKYRYYWWCPLSIGTKSNQHFLWGRKSSWQWRCPLLMLSITHCTSSQNSRTLRVTVFNPTVGGSRTRSTFQVIHYCQTWSKVRFINYCQIWPKCKLPITVRHGLIASNPLLSDMA
jgi:hypothetical protein